MMTYEEIIETLLVMMYASMEDELLTPKQEKLLEQCYYDFQAQRSTNK